AQSLFAAVILCDFRFSLREALILMALFLAQMLSPWESVRYGFSACYILLAIIMLLASKQRRKTLWWALLLRTGRPPLLDSTIAHNLSSNSRLGQRTNVERP